MSADPPTESDAPPASVAALANASGHPGGSDRRSLRPGLAKFFAQASRPGIAIVVLSSIAAGLGTAALLATINDMLRAPDTGSRLRFGLLATGVIIAGFISNVLLGRLATKALFELRLDLSTKLISLPLRALEQLGAPRVLASLTEDIPAVAATVSELPRVLTSVATIIAALAYLAWLSPSAFLIWMTVCVVGVGTTIGIVSATERMNERLRGHVSQLYRHFESLVRGAKELRLNAPRRTGFSKSLGDTASNVRRAQDAVHTMTTIATTWARSLLFAAIGVLLFAPSRYGITREVATSYVVVMIFLMSPLELLLAFLPHLSRARVAAAEIQRLGLHLGTLPQERIELPPANRVESIDVTDITYTYFDERRNRTFRLGPIDLHLSAGQLVFILGGNGSGKSTLAKILAGLYAPETGEVALNGTAVTDANRQWYREHFAAVFADYHLFDIPIDAAPETTANAEKHLRSLALDHKVSFRDGAFSRTTLSTGERKRLALIVAYLEDRPCYVFDEWAADQDPMFRRLFYTRFLPELKARGKIVVVITHDEKYFHCADDLIKIDDGLLAQESTTEFMRRLAGSAPTAMPRGGSPR